MNTENETLTARPLPPSPAPPPGPPQDLSPADARLWAMLAHLSVLLNLVTGFLGVGAALLIYLVYRDRSRYVAFQSLQSLIFQLLFWGGGGLLIGLMWTVVGALCTVLVGFFLIPFALVATVVLAAFPVIAVIYGIMGGVQCNNGEDFRYWLVGDWALNLLD